MLVTLKRKQELAKRLLADPEVEGYRSAGFINEIELRNCMIVSDYEDLRNTMNHLDAVDILSQKYFLSVERIRGILYK